MKEEVLYLEADEEITAAIDRLIGVKGETVKIVVPKRSTLLQSIVNLKLMKRAADDAGKKLVLVTGDRTATHLAGRVGLAVAATLTSEAALPEVAPETEASDTVEAEEEPVEEIPADQAAAATADMMAPSNLPGGQTGQPKSSKPAFAAPMMVRKPVDASAETAAAASAAHAGKKVPDFNTLQKRLLLAGGALGVILLLFGINYWIRRATITVYAKGTKIAMNFPFTIDPTAKAVDLDKAVLPGQTLQSSKDLTATATATGKKDVGTKAHGAVTIKNCDDTSAHSLPGGATVTSGGKSFTTDSPVSIPAAAFGPGLSCISPTVSVDITASQSGDTYNLAPASYTSPSLNSNFRINGNQMSGGTTKQVNVVSQLDVDKAKGEALTKDKELAQKDLENKVGSANRAFLESFTQTVGEVTSTPAVGEEAASSALTIKVSYSMLAVAKSDFEDMVKAQEQKKVTDQNQIYDTGIDQATITASQKDASGRQNFVFVADAFGGAKIDSKAIVELAKGKKYGDAADVVSKLPGVDRAEISLFPVWTTKLPGIAGNIKVDIKVTSQ